MEELDYQRTVLCDLDAAIIITGRHRKLQETEYISGNSGVIMANENDGKMSFQDTYKKIKEWTSSKPPIRRLATQDQLSNMEIRFCNCVIVYKLKHIETQACKYKRRKVAKYLGYSFRPLRNVCEEDHDGMFEKCVFNPSDQTIVKDHILNLETLKVRFINCRFLRRDNKTNEKLRRYWRSYYGNMIKFSLDPGRFLVNNEVIRLKDLPDTIEYMIEETANEDLQLQD